MTLPGFDENLGLFQGIEYLPIQEIIPQARVEVLNVTVLPRGTGFDESSPGSDRGYPLPHNLGDELWAVVGPDLGRDATQDEQVRQNIDNVSRGTLPPTRIATGSRGLSVLAVTDGRMIGLFDGFWSLTNHGEAGRLSHNRKQACGHGTIV